MKTKSLVALLLLTSLFSFSQQLTYKSGGNIFDSNNKKISPSEVRQLLADKPGLLNLYNEGRTKKTVGNVLLIGGLGLIVGDLANGATRDVVYPAALTYLGVASFIIAIPVKIGFSKKIKTVVEDYNKQLVNNDSKIKIESMSLYTNQGGLGIQMTF
ncbi:hypothetical protein [Flavobacterium sp.]|uniref:hypothetical protein n=1 Tax=Flavobacterium sp. TaxID=239 RepID=UPI002B4B4823|nr:hypothetical protein [Flavobacterium sp.]HLF53176.1 hypothetical protein [Flavobacterium sp.]